MALERPYQPEKRTAPVRLAALLTAGSLAVAALAGCGTASPGGAQGQNNTSTPAQGSAQNSASMDVRQFNWRVQPYQGKDQNGQPFDVESMKGKVWLADVIFTNCRTMCPVMTPNMAQIQKKATANNLSVEFVSFSCDPETDTPEVLKNYAQKYGADLKTWHFVTNGDFEKTKEFVKKTFQSDIAKIPPASPGDIAMVNHTTRFFLINRNGQVVKMYDGMNPPVDEILRDIKMQ
ncbi:MAG: SCO family protein [Alicyclobacillaceae bacterium]|nr:SCO family protein [Alicyclobacillaceae bacterium]